MVAVNYLTTHKQVIYKKAGDVIFHEGDTGERVYGVLSGQVELSHKGRVLDTLSEGGIVGEAVMLGKDAYCTTATAVSDVTLSVMERHQFLWLVQQTPTFATQLMSAMSDRVEKVAQLLD
ncbi:MAG: Crp/Fnr family transcriptional regulator [Anaerolineae bacterium]